MATAYKYEENLMNDVIISIFHKHRYIVGSGLTNDLFDILEQFITEIYLQNNVTKVDIDKYLLFDVKQKGIEVKFVPKNFICALWLAQIFPIQYDLIAKHGMFNHNGFEYSFDSKNNKLIKK